MKEQLGLLIELQKMEYEAGRLLAKKKDLPEQMKGLEEQFMAFCATAEAERERLEELRKRRREKEGQLRSGQETLKRTRERLFEIKTNKEYQSMLKEIDTLEAKNSKMEDEMLSLLEELERFEGVAKIKDTELDACRSRFAEEKRKLESELDSLAGELEICLSKSEGLKQDISVSLLRKYEQIKGVGRGIAVVSVWKEICDGCHMSIPPQLYNDLQKSTELITCPNCNRIIYWKNMNG